MKRVVVMRDEIGVFLHDVGHKLTERLNNDKFVAKVCFLSDIFTRLNALNLSMQGKNKTVVDVVESINTFKQLLALDVKKMQSGKIASFPDLSLFLEESQTVQLDDVSNLFVECMEVLQALLNKYMPDDVNFTMEMSWVRNPFHVKVENIPEELQHDFIQLQNDQVSKDKFERVPLLEFWATSTYGKLAESASTILLPFPTTYLCESGVSSLLHMKTKSRNRLVAEDDLRCSLTCNFTTKFYSPFSTAWVLLR